MEREELLVRVKTAARDLDDLVARIREYTHVDLKSLELAQQMAGFALLALASAVQGVLLERS